MSFLHIKKCLFQIQLEVPLRPRTDHTLKHKKCPAHCYNCSEMGHYGYVSVYWKESFLYFFLTISQFLLALIFTCPNLLTFFLCTFLYPISMPLFAFSLLLCIPLYNILSLSLSVCALGLEFTVPALGSSCSLNGIYCLFSLPQSHQAHSALQTQLSVSDWLNGWERFGGAVLLQLKHFGCYDAVYLQKQQLI